MSSIRTCAVLSRAKADAAASRIASRVAVLNCCRRMSDDSESESVFIHRIITSCPRSVKATSSQAALSEPDFGTTAAGGRREAGQALRRAQQARVQAFTPHD